MKNNLPVILLRGLVLLPYNDLKLEFENDASKNIIDVAELFHDNKLLVVTTKDPYDVNPDIKTLPKMGVVASITHKVVLPNGKVRVILSGLKRNKVFEYLNLNHNNGVMESIVTDIPKEEVDVIEEAAIIRKINRELDIYIRNIPYMSNSIVSGLSSIKKLDKYVDVLAPSLPVPFDRQNDYLNEERPSERARMILMDIYKEEELFNVEKDIDLKVKERIDNNQKEFILREKIKEIKEELGDISSRDDEITKLRKRLQELDAPLNIKERINDEINHYENANSASPETNIMRNYIEWLLDLPWNVNTNDNEDLIDVRHNLDMSHDGLDTVKDRIVEYLANKKMSKSLKSPIICLVGPPGVGKTTLARSIAHAMNRHFVKISLGGVSDEAEIIGHRRTYIGAAPGRIIESMKKAKTNNPVFLIDEIDKISNTIKGDPGSALLSILDPSQNSTFSDNYIEEEYDLSNVMFITTANYLDKIKEPLKDRLEIINLSGYTELEKLSIAKNHLLPNIYNELTIDKKIKIKDEIILYIIRNYTKEAGVRELERLLSTIVRKIVTKIVTKEFKTSDLNVTTKSLLLYLGKPKYQDVKVSKNIGVVNGLAYTSYGGDVLPIEINYYRGNGNLLLTGSLGDVMKESAQLALSYVKANYKNFNIDYEIFKDNDIHIHALEGAIPKEGPSAGITLLTALISALTNTKISSSIAMTGEISLHGDILPIGGLKEKAMGAYRNHIKKIIMPYDNLKDLDDIPEEVKKEIEFIPVKNYMEVYKIIKEA